MHVFPRLVNLSLPKTASTSIAELFSSYNAVHEGFHKQSVNYIIDYYEKKLTCKQLNFFILRRQKLLQIRIDSSTFLHLIAKELEDLWPSQTSFFQIIREPCSWILSYLSMLYEYGSEYSSCSDSDESKWSYRYGQFQVPGMDPVHLFRKIDNDEYIFYLIEGLACYWIRYTLHVQKSIHPNRLHVYFLSDINDHWSRLAQAAGLPNDLRLVPRKENISRARPSAKKKLRNHFLNTLDRSVQLEKASTLFKSLRNSY